MAYNAKYYIHDLDRSAFSSIQTFPAIEKIVGLYVTNVTEKMERMEYLSSSIRLNDQQMPEIYRLLPPICEKLGIDTPELYYIQSKEPNAWTFGSKYPYICVTSGLVKKLPPESVSSVQINDPYDQGSYKQCLSNPNQ